MGSNCSCVTSAAEYDQSNLQNKPFCTRSQRQNSINSRTLSLPMTSSENSLSHSHNNDSFPHQEGQWVATDGSSSTKFDAALRRVERPALPSRREHSEDEMAGGPAFVSSPSSFDSAHRERNFDGNNTNINNYDDVDDDDDDMLRDRDDDPPMIDDESAPVTSSLSLFQVCNTSRRQLYCNSAHAPSIHSARKSMVSFSESVSVHYDNPDGGKGTIPGCGLIGYDMDGGEEEGCVVTGGSSGGAAGCGGGGGGDDDDTTTTLSMDLYSRCELSDLHGSGSTGISHTRSRLPQLSETSSTLQHHPFGNNISDTMSLCSSRAGNQNVVTVPLGGEGASHREQLARPRI